MLSYNSEHTILETLDSIIKQTYKNIEVIISDDASTDNTLLVLNEWMKSNSIMSTPVKIFQNKANLGISANINRAVKRSNGEWIKLIAADDLLSYYCIEEYIKYIGVNDADVVFSPIMRFGCTVSKKRIYFSNMPFFDRKKMSCEDQYNFLLKFSPVPAPSIFISRKSIDNVGGCDESFPFLDDVPLYLRLCKYGYFLHYLDKPLTFYRYNENSITKQKNNQLLPLSYTICSLEFDRKYRLHSLKGVYKLNKLICIQSRSFILNNGNIRSLLCIFALSIYKINFAFLKLVLYISGKIKLRVLV